MTLCKSGLNQPQYEGNFVIATIDNHYLFSCIIVQLEQYSLQLLIIKVIIQKKNLCLSIHTIIT